MKIEYYTRNVYGRETMYIIDKNIAKHVAVLTGLKTLTKDHKQALEKLGHTFMQVIEPTK